MFIAFFPTELEGFRGSRREERGGREGRGRERRGGGKGGYCVRDISDGQWASISQIGSVISLGDHLGSSWSNFVHGTASKKRVFHMKNSTFHLRRTLLLEGPN